MNRRAPHVPAVSLTVLLLGAGASSLAQQRALPSTQDFMNILTVCGAGSSFKVEGDLRRSAESIYDKGRTEGKAVQEIIASITAQLPEQSRVEGYKIYSECVGGIIGSGK
jgi:hypothetical protein